MFVKICGTTSEADALLAVAMGADAIGFIFAPSPRQVAPSLVKDIIKRLPPGILTVGVFRDASPTRVVDVVRQTGLRAAQLHGHEPARDSLWVRDRIPFLIKVFPAGHPDISNPVGYGADVVMVDNENPGSGKTFDWKLLDGVESRNRLILAGGLTPENVGAAISQTKPWGVDVVSGVESKSGIKDAIKVKNFIKNARAAEPKLYQGDYEAPFDWDEE